MGVAAYSASLNVFPAPAAGSGPMGYAVCNPANGGFVVATTANRAGGTVDIGGISLESFVANQQFRICSGGYVPSDVVGALAGSGQFVDATSTGSLVRSPSPSANTIGKYQSDGGVVVDMSIYLTSSSAQQDPSSLYASSYAVDPTGAADSSSALATMDAAAVASGRYAVLTPGTYKVSANITLAANWRFSPGAQLSIDSGKVVTFTAGLDAQKVRIFSGSGTVNLRSSTIRAAFPQWWGAVFDGTIVSSGVSITSGSTTLTGSGFTAGMVGKAIVVYDRTAPTTSLVTTVAGFTNSTTITLSAAAAATIPSSSTPAHAPTTQIGACVYGTDDAAAWNAAIQACGGYVLVEGEEGAVSCVASPVVVTPSTGRAPLLDGLGMTIAAIATMTLGVVTTDNSSNSNYSAVGAVLRRFKADAARVADYGVLLGRVSYPAQGAAIAGDIRDIDAAHARSVGVEIIASQSTLIQRVTSTYSSDDGVRLKGCNETQFIQIKGTNALNSGKYGIVVDSHALGSGGCTLIGCGAEVNEGGGIALTDTTGAGPSTTVIDPWCEGNGGDAVYIARKGCLLIGGKYSNTGYGVTNTQYPFRLAGSAAQGTCVAYLNVVSAYATPNLGGRVDAGCTLYDISKAHAYITSAGGGVFMPSVADGYVTTFTAVTGGAVTVAGAVATIKDSRVTATTQVRITALNAAAVTLGTPYLSARTPNANPALSTFALTFPGAPAGTEQYQVQIEEPRI